jgi:hypothetical protein
MSQLPLREKARLASFLVWGTGLVLTVALAMTVFLSEPYLQYRAICFPIILFVSYMAAVLTRKAGSVSTLYDAIEAGGDRLYPVISVMFLNYLTHKYVRTSICLAIVSVLYSVSLLVIGEHEYIFAINFIILFYSVLLIIRLKAIENRVLSGVFGTTSQEAIELLKVS